MICKSVVAVIALLLPIAVRAQPMQGVYVGANGGAGFGADLLSATGTTKIYTNPGLVGLISLGWGFGNGLRAELEGSYRSNTIAGISTLRQNGLLLPVGAIGGAVRSYTVMANFVYDVPVRPMPLQIQPYVGVGLGVSWLDLSNASGDSVATLRMGGSTNSGPVTVNFGSAGSLAYQAMLGASLPVMPGLQATMEYRFLGSAGADVPVTRTSTDGDTINGVAFSNQTHNNFLISDHAIMIGVRYTFGGWP